MQILKQGLLVLAAVATLASCSSSKKTTSRSGRVIIIEDGRNVRVGSAKKDNGLHKGWYKNPNNPHHPYTTNPGHTKHKKGGNTVIIKNSASSSAKGGHGGKGKSKGKGKKH